MLRVIRHVIWFLAGLLLIYSGLTAPWPNWADHSTKLITSGLLVIAGVVIIAVDFQLARRNHEK